MILLKTVSCANNTVFCVNVKLNNLWSMVSAVLLFIELCDSRHPLESVDRRDMYLQGEGCYNRVF